MPALMYRVRKLRINRDGYTPEGYYYGAGRDLPDVWEVSNELGSTVVVRAEDRPDAIAAARKLLGQSARFYSDRQAE